MVEKKMRIKKVILVILLVVVVAIEFITCNVAFAGRTLREILLLMKRRNEKI